MTEEEARDVVRSMVDRAGYERLEILARLVAAENERQNLIGRSTVPMMWTRHILDSVQLLRWVGKTPYPWLDIGTGGGFPGLAVAAATGGEVILVEPRKLRAAFLSDAAVGLGLGSVSVRTAKVEAVEVAARTISARAVASVDKLLYAARHCATPATRWLLLRGRSPQDIVTIVDQPDRVFHVEQSLTDEASSVVIVEAGTQP